MVGPLARRQSPPSPAFFRVLSTSGQPRTDRQKSLSHRENLADGGASGTPSEPPKPGFFRVLSTSGQPRPPTELERVPLADLIEGHLNKVATRISFPKDVPLMISHVVAENVLVSVPGDLREGLHDDPFPPFSVDDCSFVVLPVDSSSPKELAIAFSIAKLPDAEAFIREQGQANDAPAITHRIAEKMRGRVAFWQREARVAQTSCGRTLVGSVGLGFTCYVPLDATLVKGLFEGYEVDFVKDEHFKSCTYCHSLGHRRRQCPDAPTCSKCRATNEHGPTFCTAPQLPLKPQPPSHGSGSISSTQAPQRGPSAASQEWQDAGASSKRSRRAERSRAYRRQKKADAKARKARSAAKARKAPQESLGSGQQPATPKRGTGQRIEPSSTSSPKTRADNETQNEIFVDAEDTNNSATPTEPADVVNTSNSPAAPQPQTQRPGSVLGNALRGVRNLLTPNNSGDASRTDAGLARAQSEEGVTIEFSEQDDSVGTYAPSESSSSDDSQ